MPAIAVYFIRHKPTGYYLPEPTGFGGRGGSHTEPADPEVTRPRLFRSRRAATNALGQWLRGKHVRWFCVDQFTGEYDEGVDIKPVSSRKAEDMEIAESTLNLI
jgi:hypothetical protein